MHKLIVVRGPSGAGKSTVAESLVKNSRRPTLLVSEDKVRRAFNDWRRPAHEESKDLAVEMVLFGLRHGYDVVYEGILRYAAYGKRFQKILKEHPEENYFFYLDVSFDETVIRHRTRPEKDEFDHNEMKTWWDYASPTGLPNETIIPEGSSLEETIKLISEISKSDS